MNLTINKWFFLLLFFCANAHGVPPDCAFSGEGYEWEDGQLVHWVITDTPADMEDDYGVVEGADVHTFHALDNLRSKHPQCNERYGKDARQVFFGKHRIVGADPRTFEIISADYSKDKNAVFYQSARLTERVQQFRILGFYYATDGRNGFFRDKVLDGEGLHLMIGNDEVALSRTNVYQQGELVQDADPQTYAIHAGNCSSYATDKNHVFFDGKAVPNADPATFTELGCYSKVFTDKRAVYFHGKEVPEIHRDSVRFSKSGSHLIDDVAVYAFGDGVQRLEGCDINSFEELDGPWARDKFRVYFGYGRLPMADLASFHTTKDHFGEDKNFSYANNVVFCKFDQSSPMRVPLCNAQLAKGRSLEKPKTTSDQ